MHNHPKLPIIHLPQLRPEDFVTCYAQQRPKRNGGYRIERVEAKGKTIIHNYGHGGAGVSLAPGSGKEAVQIAPTATENGEAAILGSGVIGLFTCFYLLQKYPNCRVTIYADKIPKFGDKDNSKLITSQVAPGFWFPFHFGGENDERNKRIAEESFQFYTALSMKQQYRQLVKQVDVYEIADDKEIQEQYSNFLPEQIKHTFKEIDVLLGKQPAKARTLQSLKIDMQSFLHTFASELKQKGVQFVQRTFNQQKVFELKEPVIFNCTGLASRYLFGDSELRGVKGHLLQYRNTDPSIYNCIVTANIGKQTVDYYMHSSRILLGLTEEDVDDCRVDQRQVKMLQQAHRQVLIKHAVAEALPAL